MSDSDSPVLRRTIERASGGAEVVAVEPARTGSIAPKSDSSFSPGLGALRGIAASGVLVFHVFLVLPIAGIDSPHRQYIDAFDGPLLAQHVFLSFFNGRGLVTLFFVLSGCVLAMSLDRHVHFGIRDLPAYWVRRGTRLYPLLIVAATFGALLQSQVEPGAMSSTSDWADWHYNVAKEDLPSAWAENAIGWSSSLNSPAWSIRVELVASLVFPALYWLTKSGKRAALATVALILLMFVPESLGAANLNIYAFCFFAGALVPAYGKRWVDRYTRLSVTQRRLLLAAAVLMFMFARQVIEPVSISPAVVLVETLCSSFIVSLVLFRPTPSWMESRSLQYLGRTSYGVYLLHLIVLFALVYLFLADLPPSDTSQALLFVVVLCGATFLITLPLAGLLYASVEVPMQRLGSRVAHRLNKRLADPSGETSARGTR